MNPVEARIRSSMGIPAGAVGVDLTLPRISGEWFYVDPELGVDTQSGSINAPVKTLQAAYDLCTDGAGDGVCFFSRVTAGTTSSSPLYKKLTWAKYGITVFGVGAPIRMAQRARIVATVVSSSPTASTVTCTASVITRSTGSFVTDGWIVGMTGTLACSGGTANTNQAATIAVTAVTASTLTVSDTLTAQTAAECTTWVITSSMATMIDVSGGNNTFINLHMTHMLTGSALNLTTLKVSGERNAFINVHAAHGLATAATVLTRALWLTGDENTFRGCVFGTDTVNRGNNATYDILISGTVKRNRFIDCETNAYASTGVAKMAVYFSGTVGGSPTMFDNCRFMCNNVTEMTAALGGTGSNDKIFLTGGTCHPGYAALGLGTVAYISGANIAAGVGGKLTTTA